MSDESKDLPPPSGATPQKPQSVPQPDPPTDAPPPDPATTPKPPGEPEIPGPPGPPPSDDRPSGAAAGSPPGPPPAEDGNTKLAGAVPDGAKSGMGGGGAKLAPLGSRIGAAVIDLLVAVALGWMVASIVPETLGGFLSWVVSSAYWVARDSLAPLKGQSLGKMALKLRAVSKSGRDLVNDWQTGLLRNVLLLVPFGGLIELIVLLVRQGKPEAGMRLGDDWARTRVVEEPAPSAE